MHHVCPLELIFLALFWYYPTDLKKNEKNSSHALPPTDVPNSISLCLIARSAFWRFHVHIFGNSHSGLRSECRSPHCFSGAPGERNFCVHICIWTGILGALAMAVGSQLADLAASDPIPLEKQCRTCQKENLGAHIYEILWTCPFFLQLKRQNNQEFRQCQGGQI